MPARETPIAIAARGLSKRYPLPGGDFVRALDAFTLEVPVGACLGVLGARASGKSTLLGLLAGRLAPDAGRVDYPAGDRPTAGCLIPPDPAVAPSPPARALHAALGTSGLADRPAGALSSGELARMELDHALTRPGAFLFLDDPRGLDADAANAAAPAFSALQRAAPRTVLIATTSPEVALALCTRVIVLRAGRVVLDRAVADLPDEEDGCSIRIRGRLGPERSAWFDGLHVRPAGSDTLISGLLPDPTALYGLLERARDLGLELLSVERGGPGSAARLLAESMG